MRFLHIAHAHIDIETLAEQIDAAVEQFQVDIEIAVVLPQQRQNRRNVFAPKPETRADANQSARLARHTGERVRHALHVVENFLRLAEGCFAIVGDGDAPHRAQKKLHAERLLASRCAC